MRKTNFKLDIFPLKRKPIPNTIDFKLFFESGRNAGNHILYMGGIRSPKRPLAFFFFLYDIYSHHSTINNNRNARIAKTFHRAFGAGNPNLLWGNLNGHNSRNSNELFANP